VLEVGGEHVLAPIGEPVALHPPQLDAVQPQSGGVASLRMAHEQCDALEIEGIGQLPDAAHLVRA
jgi:hypothetical protein